MKACELSYSDDHTQRHQDHREEQILKKNIANHFKKAQSVLNGL